MNQSYTYRQSYVSNSTDTCACLYVANASGEPRWIWPAASTSPLFLQFIQPTTWRQRLFVALIQLVFALRMQRLLLKSCFYAVPQGEEKTNWALFTGTPGPNRKQICINAHGEVTKLAVGKLALANLRNEEEALLALAEQEAAFSFKVPQLLSTKASGLVIEQLVNRGTWREFTERHIVALEEIRQIQPTTVFLENWEGWHTIQDRLIWLKKKPHAEIPTPLIEKLEVLFGSLNLKARVKLGVTHGDFTPWNTLKLANNQLGIIDWEMYHHGMPLGFDFFHFHLQRGILLDRKSWSQIYTDITAALTPESTQHIFGAGKVDIDQYLRLYLLSHCSYYLALYLQQAKWHEQVYWQLSVWADALSALTPVTDQRKHLIKHLFTLLEGKAYGVLKMGQEDPQELPVNSDLDIIISRRDASTLISQLKQYPGIAKFNSVQKSFMASLLLLTHDEQVLNIDLIWQIKRKQIVFMDAGKLIKNAQLNPLGISVITAEDTSEYLHLFYSLNGASVPEQYQLTSTATPPNHNLSGNRGFSSVKNLLLYFWDTLRTMANDRGYVLTFSGVDGAGKSTIIEEVVQLLDKQFRRPVKVLRHRPSLLPILSALRYGKAAAEQKSVASLPRTGTNTSIISSLLRFSYYFTDYLVGQWYVYFRYVLRGYVVVYDRYYYDFMVDGRRSNLELPHFITKAGFKLIQKPAYNFFLYADADIIRERKQELSKEDITTLTERYQTLFADCDAKYPNHLFTALNNVHLTNTVATIRKALLLNTIK